MRVQGREGLSGHLGPGGGDSESPWTLRLSDRPSPGVTGWGPPPPRPHWLRTAPVSAWALAAWHTRGQSRESRGSWARGGVGCRQGCCRDSQVPRQEVAFPNCLEI